MYVFDIFIRSKIENRIKFNSTARQCTVCTQTSSCIVARHRTSS